MMQTLWALAQIFTQLSVLAFGGGNTILPEMQRQVVDVHGWMTAADFSALFALGQAAPGPNLMVVTLVGWHVAGWSGMLVTTLAKFGPSSIITVIARWDCGNASGPALARHRAGRHLSHDGRAGGRQRLADHGILGAQLAAGRHHGGGGHPGQRHAHPSTVAAVRRKHGGFARDRLA